MLMACRSPLKDCGQEAVIGFLGTFLHVFLLHAHPQRGLSCFSCAHLAFNQGVHVEVCLECCGCVFICLSSLCCADSPLHVSHRPLLTEAIVLEGLDSTPLSPLNPVDLCSALLDDCMPGGPEESASERAELTDALDAIDSSQPQVPSSPDASRPSLDLLRELFSPTSFLSSAYLDAEEEQLLKRCSESAEEDRGHSQPQKIKAEMVQYGAPQEGCEEEDILPTLLQLAQEVSNTGPCPGELTPGPAPPAPGLACS
nr:PREDICTED: uncharacterized protein LOC102695203 [Lepisosteus oculatus]